MLSMQQSLFSRIDGYRSKLERMNTQLSRRPAQLAAQQRLKLTEMQAKLKNTMNGRITAGRMVLLEASGMLEKNNPAAMLGRGYGVIRRDGARIRRAEELAAGEEISIRMQDGTVRAEVTEVVNEI